MSFNYRNYGSISKLFGATEVDQQTETDGPEAPELYFASSLCLYQKRKEKKKSLHWDCFTLLSTRDE